MNQFLVRHKLNHVSFQSCKCLMPKSYVNKTGHGLKHVTSDDILKLTHFPGNKLYSVTVMHGYTNANHFYQR